METLGKSCNAVSCPNIRDTSDMENDEGALEVKRKRNENGGALGSVGKKAKSKEHADVLAGNSRECNGEASSALSDVVKNSERSSTCPFPQVTVNQCRHSTDSDSGVDSISAGDKEGDTEDSSVDPDSSSSSSR